MLAVDDRAVRDGIGKWHDAALWHRSKQEVSPTAGPLYGDLVGRWMAAKQGRSFKCLVLDLDNTVWGGVIGDDGLEGIALGQGSPLGEAYIAFQEYARELSRRGVILAVCSKNDEANALEPFEKHPDMVLKRGDIASFVANWSNKADNIRAIAQELNIGLDSLVLHRRQPVRAELGAPGTADGGGAGGIGRPDRLSASRWPMPDISRVCQSPMRTASAPRSIRATRRAMP